MKSSTKLNSEIIDDAKYRFEPNWCPPKEISPVKTAIASIDALNLERIKKKSTDADSGYGWSTQVAEEIGELYRVFLFLCKKYPDEVIVPTREVDEFWHLHILDTRNYITDCENIFGSFLHHFPYAGLEGTQVDSHEEQGFIENTIRLVRRHFPNILDDKREQKSDA